MALIQLINVPLVLCRSQWSEEDSEDYASQDNESRDQKCILPVIFLNQSEYQKNEKRLQFGVCPIHIGDLRWFVGFRSCILSPRINVYHFILLSITN